MIQIDHVMANRYVKNRHPPSSSPVAMAKQQRIGELGEDGGGTIRILRRDIAIEDEHRNMKDV